MNPDTCLKAIWIHFLVLSLTNALEASRESFRKTFEPFDKWIKADKRKEICSNQDFLEILVVWKTDRLFLLQKALQEIIKSKNSFR